MKTLTVAASPREHGPKAVLKQIRQNQQVPAVVHKNGVADMITLNYNDAKAVLFTPETYVVKLDVNGSLRDAIVREAQYHPVKDTILHIDFLDVSAGQEVVINLPIRTVGTAAGVIKGGRLITKLRKVKVKGVPAKMPAAVDVDISNLEIDQTIKVSDIKVADLNIVTSPSAAIASVERTRAMRSAASASK